MFAMFMFLLATVGKQRVFINFYHTFDVGILQAFKFRQVDVTQKAYPSDPPLTNAQSNCIYSDSVVYSIGQEEDRMPANLRIN